MSRRAKVINLAEYLERRRRMQATCGHSMTSIRRGVVVCAYCGARLPGRCSQLELVDVDEQ